MVLHLLQVRLFRLYDRQNLVILLDTDTGRLILHHSLAVNFRGGKKTITGMALCLSLTVVKVFKLNNRTERFSSKAKNTSFLADRNVGV